MISPREFAERWTGNGSAEETADARKLEQLVADRDREHQESPSVIADLRRLVEEAKAETKEVLRAKSRWESAYAEASTERGRLRGELAEAIANAENDRACWRRANAELAEARRLLNCGYVGCTCTPWHSSHEAEVKAFLAAPPAEQAQPTATVRDSLTGQAHPALMLADVAAEQAQGEGAPHVTCETVPKGEWCFGCGEALTPSNRHTGPACIIETSIAALAKRVNALTNLVTSLARDSATQGAMVEVQNKVAALEAERPGKGWVGHYCDQPTACPHRMTPPAPSPPEAPTTADGTPYRWDGKRWVGPSVPPTPEAAGPEKTHDCYPCFEVCCNGDCRICGVAVPPIPEGK